MTVVRLATSPERAAVRAIQTFAQSEALRLAMWFGSVSDEGRQDLRIAYAHALVREASANAALIIETRTRLNLPRHPGLFHRALLYLFGGRG